MFIRHYFSKGLSLFKPNHPKYSKLNLKIKFESNARNYSSEQKKKQNLEDLTKEQLISVLKNKGKNSLFFIVL